MHIKWTSHAASIANRISKHIGVTNRLKIILPLHILRTLHNTLILPHLYYGILLWGHGNNRLHMLQKQVIRIITISKYNAHTEPLCKALNIINYNTKYNENLYHTTLIL